ncbi:hypothetical protein G6L37_25110 [Agrobacterium rubi]|uniref:ClpX C4-type zinc finger protein n=1 Tax=Agrobacterium rubi TaxID=28099 RepID=UPI0005EBB593|nr:ClpX C4-type zinc finger protein [Agrobacterium rubi]MBP1878604.1 hypothetical protein [Agrobacterium rubi]MCL6653035.1 hypothetical protein [Agrobacterium rubi]NTF10133.1 hypothetical protein [Agrobacterium rubi]NTF21689.1 hypothetical protein [Agrobacterium rubi]NTF28546.1 hypothetical protein [Agrobacterium rubi]
MNQLSIKDRLHAARRVLFGRSDNAVICSFCGKSRQDGVGNIVAGPRVAICASCARIALDWNLTSYFQDITGTTIDTFSIFYQHQACLLSQHRSQIDEELQWCAGAFDAELMGWNYGWAKGDFVDGLTVYVRIRNDVNIAIFRETFTQTYLRLASSDMTSPRTSTLAAPWPSETM